VNEAAELITQYRAANDLPPVVVDPVLMQIATFHTRRMAHRLGELTHAFPREVSFQQRLVAGNYQTLKAVENLAGGLENLQKVLDLWKNSALHNLADRGLRKQKQP